MYLHENCIQDTKNYVFIWKFCTRCKKPLALHGNCIRDTKENANCAHTTKNTCFDMKTVSRDKKKHVFIWKFYLAYKKYLSFYQFSHPNDYFFVIKFIDIISVLIPKWVPFLTKFVDILSVFIPRWLPLPYQIYVNYII